jgi:hypothetical protein
VLAAVHIYIYDASYAICPATPVDVAVAGADTIDATVVLVEPDVVKYICVPSHSTA